VSLVFFGEGGSNHGNFHESLNMAAAWDLPVIYVCENNLYAMSTHIREVSRIQDVALRAEAYDMMGVIVDGNDVLAVRDAVTRAAVRARSGSGPTLIEAKTYRHYGHSKSDKREYRTEEEEQGWHKRDPIGRFGAWLTRHALLDPLTDANIRAEVDALVEEAVQFAQSAPEPSAEEAGKGVFV
jgi:TPP-dependent pyruvate/acetoin dehydrogenase alpha subunit